MFSANAALRPWPLLSSSFQHFHALVVSKLLSLSQLFLPALLSYPELAQALLRPSMSLLLLQLYRRLPPDPHSSFAMPNESASKFVQSLRVLVFVSVDQFWALKPSTAEVLRTAVSSVKSSSIELSVFSALSVQIHRFSAACASVSWPRGKVQDVACWKSCVLNVRASRELLEWLHHLRTHVRQI